MTTTTTSWEVISFGCNDDGQLGRDTSNNKELEDAVCESQLPASIPLLSSTARFPLPIQSLSCGSRHTMALLTNGSIYSWGWGKMGQLGHGNDCSLTTPKLVSFFADMTMSYISAGGCHSGALDVSGQVYMWGESHWGQLGITQVTRGHQMLPLAIKVSSDPSVRITALSCGGSHTAAITESGGLYMWGRGDNGQCGIGRDWLETNGPGAVGVDVPTLLPQDDFQNEAITRVSCGAFHTACITTSGNVYTWGKDDHGMLGLGFTTDVHEPKRVPFFNDLTTRAGHVSCGGWHTVVVSRDGQCFSFGRGEYGRLGLGHHTSKMTPTAVLALQSHTIMDVSCGGTHTLFLSDTGEVFSTGRLGHGRLGFERQLVQAIPQVIQTARPVVHISVGGAHSLLVLS